MLGIYATFVMSVVAEEDTSRVVWPSCPASGWTNGVNRLSGCIMHFNPPDAQTRFAQRIAIGSVAKSITQRWWIHFSSFEIRIECSQRKRLHFYAECRLWYFIGLVNACFRRSTLSLRQHMLIYSAWMLFEMCSNGWLWGWCFLSEYLLVEEGQSSTCLQVLPQNFDTFSTAS